MLTDKKISSCFNAEKFANDIRKARKGRGLTTRQIGDVIGKSHVQVHKWENLKAEPRLSDFGCLCYFFDLDPVWYFIIPKDIEKIMEMFP